MAIPPGSTPLFLGLFSYARGHEPAGVPAWWGADMIRIVNIKALRSEHTSRLMPAGMAMSARVPGASHHTAFSLLPT